MTEKHEHDIDAIIKIAQDAAKPEAITPSEHGLLFVPGVNGHEHEVIDLDKFGKLPTPRRKSGTIIVFNIESLNTWIERNKDAGNVVIYLDENAKKPQIIAVLNDNGATGPGHRDMRCIVVFRPTVEWQKWVDISGKMMPQVDFAEFIEENLNDIFSPPGAEMLEIVTYLQATRSVNFKSAVSLSSGQVQFQNVESIDTKVRATEVQIPTEFKLAIAPIQGSERFEIPARFRYRLVDGQLRLGLKLLRTEDVIDQIFKASVGRINGFAELTVVDGTP